MIIDRTGQHLSVCGVIPARMESVRLPGKPLRPIAGRPMIGWVYGGARESATLDRLIVATDSEPIMSYCASSGFTAAMTSSRHTSGTDRLVEVMEQEGAAGRAADIYVNIQGDEPMVAASHINVLLSAFGSPPAGIGAAYGQTAAAPTAQRAPQRRPDIEVSTLKVAMSSESASDPNAVKVVTDLAGMALYFSRSPIPYHRGQEGTPQYYKHLGFYAYTAGALQRFRTLVRTPLEQAERLEQLRFLENGMRIAVMETDQDSIGVDTEEDLLRVEAYFRRTGKTQ
jgi:3-deoxy-manno-octulosonate cytidylyltransferase (CMP-KDO synthetase)